MKFNTDSAIRTALFFTIFAILLSESVITHGSMYGENDDYLGQIVDDYENDDYIQFNNSVIHNETLDCMELKYTIGTGAMILEDFTAYTEVDEGNGITVVSPIYVDVTLSRTQTRYIYYDFGVDFLGNYKLYGKFRQDYHNANAQGLFMLMSNYNLGDEQDHRDNSEDYTCITLGGTLGNLGLREYYLGSFYKPASKQFPDDTFYWFKLEKTGTLLELDVYTTLILRDAEGTGDWFDEELTLQADHKFRYLHLASSHDDVRPEMMNMEIYDVYINGTSSGYAVTGYYYTVDMLGDDRALNMLYNASILGGTNMTIEFSEDNNTWVNHNNVAGYDVLVHGFEAIDLRDINCTELFMRVNFSTIAPSNTSRMYQIRLATIIGAVEVGGGGINSSSIIIAIFLILVASGLIYGVKK